MNKFSFGLICGMAIQAFLAGTLSKTNAITLTSQQQLTTSALFGFIALMMLSLIGLKSFCKR